MVIRRDMTIRNRLGLHARAAGTLVKLASTFEADLTVEKEEVSVNAKSIMGLLLLAAAPGSRLTLVARGADEDEAARAIEELVRRKFDEE